MRQITLEEPAEKGSRHFVFYLFKSDTSSPKYRPNALLLYTYLLVCLYVCVWGGGGKEDCVRTRVFFVSFAV